MSVSHAGQFEDYRQLMQVPQNATDVELGLKAGKAAGLRVFRTWGFYDKNATFDPHGLPQYGGEGAGPSDIYFRKWTNGKSEISMH